MKQYYEDEVIEEQGKLKTLLRWCVDIVAVIALAVFAVMMFGTKVTVSGRSMEPTAGSGEVVLLNKLWYNFSEPKQFDVVAFHGPTGDTKTYIKRIVGIPGDRVQITDGKLYINDMAAELPGTPGAITLPGLAEHGVTLKEDEYFVLGDNPDTSEDSRFANVGNVHRTQIEGKVWFRVSPFDRMGFVK